jgi:hypothetical protein
MQGAASSRASPSRGVTRSGRGAVTGAPGRPSGPAPHRGREYVVNCAGMWARQLGELSGVPSRTRRRSTTTSSPKPCPTSKSWPVLEDPASYAYFREEGGGLMVGLFEAAARRGRSTACRGLLLWPDPARLGPHGPVPREGHGARSRASRCRRASRSSSAGPRASPPTCALRRRGARAQELLRRRGAQLHRHPDGRRPRPRDGPLDSTESPDMDVTGVNIDRLHTYQANPEYRRTARSSHSAWSTSATTRPTAP